MPPKTISLIVQELWHFVWTWSKISEENSYSKFLRAAPTAGSAHHEGFQLQPSCDEKCQGIQEITSRGSQGTTQYHPWSAFGTWTTGKYQVFFLKFSFSEKVTKIWKNIPLVLTLLSENNCFVITGGRFFQILWPSHNVWILTHFLQSVVEIR